MPIIGPVATAVTARVAHSRGRGKGLHARPTMQCSRFSSPAAFQPAWLVPGQRAARPSCQERLA